MTDLATRPEVKSARGKRSQLREVRSIALEMSDIELRDAAEGSTPGFTGYACVTDAPYEMHDMFGPYEEVVQSGAFQKTLSEKDNILLLLDHDTGQAIARVSAGSLTLAEDDHGLLVNADFDLSDPDAVRAYAKLRNGTWDSMSFGFRVTRQQWSPDYMQRDILEVELFEVSIVSFPANPNTSAQLRAAIGEQLREQVSPARANAMLCEIREGKALSTSTMDVLSQVLDLIAQADVAVDEAQPLLADLMGVPNPDEDEQDSDSQGIDDDSDDDPGSEDRGILPLALAKAQLEADRLRARRAA